MRTGSRIFHDPLLSTRGQGVGDGEGESRCASTSVECGPRGTQASTVSSETERQVLKYKGRRSELGPLERQEIKGVSRLRQEFETLRLRASTVNKGKDHETVGASQYHRRKVRKLTGPIRDGPAADETPSSSGRPYTVTETKRGTGRGRTGSRRDVTPTRVHNRNWNSPTVHEKSRATTWPLKRTGTFDQTTRAAELTHVPTDSNGEPNP